MEKNRGSCNFSETDTIHSLKHFLPAQAPLKDFIHHNPLHALQDKPFFSALQSYHQIFGAKVLLQIVEYQELYKKNVICEKIFERVIDAHKGSCLGSDLKAELLSKSNKYYAAPKIGKLRRYWKTHYKIDLDAAVHPNLFRILSAYLDQGVSIWHFPASTKGFMASVRDFERNSFIRIFKSRRVRDLLFNSHTSLTDLLHLLVADSKLYPTYLFDQQFAHPGWSGMVSYIEDNPKTLIDKRIISLHDLLFFELLLEIDFLDKEFGQNWLPIGNVVSKSDDFEIFSETIPLRWFKLQMIWHEAFEWSYYDQVLHAIRSVKTEGVKKEKSFQAVFCIDDRECSIRRHIERLDPQCETFGTPGFFGVAFYFKTNQGGAMAKLCPAPLQPTHLIKELSTKKHSRRDWPFTKLSHTLLGGWLISNTIGFWAAFRLFINIFKPSMSPAVASSLQHSEPSSKLTIAHEPSLSAENHLKVGFTTDEMVDLMDYLLKSMGFTQNFAPIVYLIGHGSSTVNNPHYAAYDCGACSGKPGSVNARVAAHMLNTPEVRRALSQRSIFIPDKCVFIAGIHDTTLDEIHFFLDYKLSPESELLHKNNVKVFMQACAHNAKERARKFESINMHTSLKDIHKKIKQRAVSLFEPRPELNHANNALCIVGRRSLTKNLFLDRRTFLNSYDYTNDPNGDYLAGILNALVPVCGGINLEYFFSRVDNCKLGAGTKLPHNIVGLVGVSNGIEGDLRPGLPSQMIELHDPVRLLLIIESFPDKVLAVIKRNEKILQWFDNQWMHLVSVEPETKQLYYYANGMFYAYDTLNSAGTVNKDLEVVFVKNRGNLPVYLLEDIE